MIIGNDKRLIKEDLTVVTTLSPARTGLNAILLISLFHFTLFAIG